MELFDK